MFSSYRPAFFTYMMILRELPSGGVLTASAMVLCVPLPVLCNHVVGLNRLRWGLEKLSISWIHPIRETIVDICRRKQAAPPPSPVLDGNAGEILAPPRGREYRSELLDKLLRGRQVIRHLPANIAISDNRRDPRHTCPDWSALR
ncbi:hypothetical protein HPP92_028643 [Vanilla planifolia]|uniref:Uncharacterized protein n=1 Tax=Vanilla planifolia TaxID=51239 RepID=A0A835U5I1_VANPL|nr:hypothetical protein HPP92_028643 [Vanilla planifolia]